ncbi:MAG: hypothetical protein FJW26_02860 [Acidimicrobiia bacterium]|nr:hypothetical protein [Acidimicrobiia bacterium]
MTEFQHLLDPLESFYRAAGMALPKAVKVESPKIPEPYRGLLAHQNDMTPTLEAAYGQRIHLRVLAAEQSAGVMLRQVSLVLDLSEQPVEFGAIRIQLANLLPEARGEILEGKLPLGRVLQDFDIQHSSQPSAYFAVKPDVLIGAALQIDGYPLLYGRRNRLLLPSSAVLAEVVEILGPYDRASR